jgi:hypothetical protein
MTESYAGSFPGRNGQVDVFKNPSRRELQSLVQHDTVRMFLDNGDVLAWKPYDALHGELIFQAGEDLGMTRDALPILLYCHGREAHCSVTDYSKQTKWFHNPTTAAIIMQNRYLRSMFSTITVSYFDDDIVGVWTELTP